MLMTILDFAKSFKDSIHRVLGVFSNSMKTCVGDRDFSTYHGCIVATVCQSCLQLDNARKIVQNETVSSEEQIYHQMRGISQNLLKSSRIWEAAKFLSLGAVKSVDTEDNTMQPYSILE